MSTDKTNMPSGTVGKREFVFQPVWQALFHAELEERKQLGLLDARIAFNHSAADKFLSSLTALFRRGRVQVQILPVAADDLAAFHHAFQDGSEELLALLQRLSISLPFRDEPSHPGQQLFNGKGFGYVVLCPLPEQFYAKGIIGLGGEHDDGHIIHFPMAAQRLHHLIAAHAGHHYVTQDQVGMKLECPCKTLFTVEGGGDPVVPAQGLGHVSVHVGVVFDHQNERGIRRRCRRTGYHGGGRAELVQCLPVYLFVYGSRRGLDLDTCGRR